MELVLYIIGAWLLFPFLQNPIALRVKHREFPEPRFEPILPESLPQEVKSYLESIGSEFQAAGFIACALTTTGNPAGNVQVYVSLWFHRQKCISAYALVGYMRAPNSPPIFFSKSMSFVTRFSETSQWETSNSEVPTPLARIPTRPYLQLPTETDFRRLFEAHQILAARFHPGTERLRPAEGQELAMMIRKMTEVNRYQVEVGRWVMDTKENVYRLTWKGAIINGWQYAWSVNGMRKWLLRRRAKRTLSSLGLTGR